MRRDRDGEEEIERIWRDLLFAAHATSVGAITSLALAAIDTALRDLRRRRASLPLWRMAEAHNAPIRPHFLIDPHVSLVCAVPNAPWLEYITRAGLRIEAGRAYPSDEPGIGIDRDWDAIARQGAMAPLEIR